MPIHIPTPCHKDWDKMTPTERGRHCAACNKVVRDFTHHTPGQIEAELKQQAAGSICGRIKTSSTPPPLPRRHLQRAAMVAGMVSALMLATADDARAQINLQPPPPPKALPDSVSSITELPTRKPDYTKDTFNFSGSVIDEETNEPLAFANVLVYDGEALITGAVTDLEGEFSIDVEKDAIANKTIRLEVQYIGYESYTVNDIVISKADTAMVVPPIVMDSDKIVCTVGLIIVVDEVESAMERDLKSPWSQTTITRDMLDSWGW